MSNSSNIRSDFIEKAEAIILENISNEQFGVSELAEAMNMSRSNLLRKIKKDKKAFCESVYSSGPLNKKHGVA